MTPAQYCALAEVKQNAIRRADKRAGAIITVMRRIMGDRTAEIFDFFPEHKEDDPRPRQTGEQVRANFRGLIDAQKRIKKARHG